MSISPLRAELAQTAVTDRVASADRRRQVREATELDRLVRAAAAGDQAAWAALFRRFSGAIRSVARAHRLAPQDADDVLQATWLRLHRNIGGIREPAALGLWLRTTARRESLRLLASNAREQPSGSDLLDDLAAPDEADQLVERERREALLTAMSALPERHQRLMRVLATDPDLGYAEISAVVGMPIGSIGPIRQRCLARLRRDRRLVTALDRD